MAAAGKIHKTDSQWTAELKTITSDKHAAQTRYYCTEICWALGHCTNNGSSGLIQFNNENTLKANLDREPRAMRARSRWFTSVPLTPWAHGNRVDRSDQSTGSFPNHCGLVRWSRERELLPFQVTARWLLTVPSAFGFTVLTGGRSYVLSWKWQLSPRRRGYRIFGHKSQELLQQSLPSYWNRGLFCQEGSALSIQSKNLFWEGKDNRRAGAMDMLP